MRFRSLGTKDEATAFCSQRHQYNPPRYHSDIQSQIIRRPWRPLTGDGIKAVKGLWGHVNQSGLNDLEHFSFCWSKKMGAQQTSWFIMIYHDIQLKSWNPWMNLGGSEALKAPQRSLAAKNAPRSRPLLKCSWTLRVYIYIHIYIYVFLKW